MRLREREAGRQGRREGGREAGTDGRLYGGTAGGGNFFTVHYCPCNILIREAIQTNLDNISKNKQTDLTMNQTIPFTPSLPWKSVHEN